jgi:HD-like signal output (HDOD) protein
VVVPFSAADTVAKSRQAMREGHSAGLPELLELIKTLSGDISTVTISELSELIEKDATVLTRVLKVANTIHHNPGIRQLSSLTHAIHRIGFTRVRSLTVSLLLFAHAGRRNPLEQREAATRALCAGLLTQGCARHFGFIDTETVFACNAVRHFGRILLPSVSLEHFREALRLSRDQPEAAAMRQLFGLTPLELSRELLADAHLPEEISRTLHESRPEEKRGDPTRWNARMLTLVEFSDQIATLALDPSVFATQFLERAGALAEKHGRGATDLRDGLPDAFTHVDRSLAIFLRTAGAGSLPNQSLQRLQARAAQLRRANLKSTLTPPFAPSPARPAPTPQMPFETAPVADDEPDKFDPWVAPLHRVAESFVADEVWLFESAEKGASFTLVRGIGAHCAEIRHGAVLRAEDRTVFGIALTRREAVVIHQLRDPALRRYLPDWLLQSATTPPSLLIFPLFQDHRVSGLAVVGWSQARRVKIEKPQLDLARHSLQQAQRLLLADVAP